MLTGTKVRLKLYKTRYGYNCNMASSSHTMELVAPATTPIMVANTLTPGSRMEHYMAKPVLELSRTQIAIGALCIILQFFLFFTFFPPVHFIGHGLWAGIFFIITGVFGIKSSRRKTSALIVTFLALTVVSALLTIVIIIASSVAIVAMLYGFGGDRKPRWPTRFDPIMFMNAVMFILGLIEAVVAIVCSALSCHGLCARNQNKPVVVAGQVQYLQGPGGQQQMVILPLEQHPRGLVSQPTANSDQIQPPLHVQDTPPPAYDETKLTIPHWS